MEASIADFEGSHFGFFNTDFSIFTILDKFGSEIIEKELKINKYI